MRRAIPILMAACLLSLSACASPAPAVPPTPLPTTTQASNVPTPAPVVVQAVQPQSAPQPRVAPVSSPSPVSLPLSVLAGRSGADLRVTLASLLQEDAFFSAIAADAAINARLDAQIGVTSMLDQNATTTAGIVASVDGPPSAEALLDAWRAQTRDLLSYAQGQSAPARADLDVQRPLIAEKLASGDFSQSQVDQTLQRRVQAQLALIDSLAAHDPTSPAMQLANLEALSDDLARQLSAAMASHVPALSPANTEGADVSVRSGLSTGLISHLLLTAAACEAASDGRSTESQAYAAAADTIANDLGSQLNNAFGSDIGSGIAERLRAETADYLSVAENTNRSQAAADIDRLRSEIDAQLSAANQLLAPGLLNQQLRATDQALLSAADAFAARDFMTAFARVHEAVKQAQKPAATLALAIVDRYPARYLDLSTPAPAPPPGG